jgi:hypothetical protein
VCELEELPATLHCDAAVGGAEVDMQSALLLMHAAGGFGVRLAALILMLPVTCSCAEHHVTAALLTYAVLMTVAAQL